jgi:hypothetical protein
MTCQCCNEARQAPEHFRLFAEGCLHCAARRIQYIQRRLALPASSKAERCRLALTQALAHGLPEAEIRSMAKRAEWQLQPNKKG